MERFQAAADIKVQRVSATFDRLNPEYLADWRKGCTAARADFVRGDITRREFVERMEALGFRSDALKAEVLDAERDKNNPGFKAPTVVRYFRYEFKR